MLLGSANNSAYFRAKESTMSLYKSAQAIDIDDLKNLGNEDQVILYEEKPSPQDVVEMHNPEHREEVEFCLPKLPGCNEEQLEVSTEDEEPKNKKEDKNDLEAADPWSWKQRGMPGVLGWAKGMLGNVPRHSGRETTGCERAIAFLKRIDRELSNAASNDFNGEIDIGAFERIRQEVRNGIERLEDHCDKLQGKGKKKEASEEDGIVKQAGATRISGIVITVPLRISAIARICINGTVSGGCDIERTYADMVKKYALDDGEELELTQLLMDMGFPMRKDRGLKNDEKFDPTSVDNYDYAANYYS